MSRGYMYEITTDIDHVGFMDESDFYEDLGLLNADYVRDVDDKTAKEFREDLFHLFQDYGAATGEEAHLPLDDDEAPEEMVPYVIFNDDVKRNYFRNRFLQMQKMASEISLDQFAIESGDRALWDLQHALENTYGDVAYLNGAIYTMDYFVRDAEPGVKYYLGNVVFVH